MKKANAAFDEAGHKVHDYGHLIARWRRIARSVGLILRPFARVGEFPVYYLRTRGPLAGGFYVSAGIHGDEPAGPTALALWAETHLATLVRAPGALPLFILPCLNPWGLVENRRSDPNGRDLNRSFHRRVSPAHELKRLLVGTSFALGVALHEDYDGCGVYLYETSNAPGDLGAALLRACKSKTMPIDSRRRIERFLFKDGLLRHRIQPEDVDDHPEAFALYPRHAPRFITFETPSEFGLAHRVRAHVRLLEGCVRHLQQTRASLVSHATPRPTLTLPSRATARRGRAR